MDLHIFTDGASRGNIGDAAIAFSIGDKNGRILLESGKCIGTASNNEAEYRAVIEALSQAAKYSGGKPPRVFLYSDSQLVVGQLTGEYEVKKAHLKRLYSRVKRMEKRFKNVSYRHLPRTNSRIARVDALVNKALDEGR